MLDSFLPCEGELEMMSDQKVWLDEYAVTCRVFKGRWSIRHCLRLYSEMSDLKIRMATRANGKITRHESAYNPCERCKVLGAYLEKVAAENPTYDSTEDASYNQIWAV